MSNYADAIAALSPEQRSRLTQRLTPLSFPQEQLWLLHQLAPKDCTYNVQYTLRARGPLDLDRLHEAVLTVVRRHAVLRTSFAEIDGGAWQIIHQAADAGWSVEDLRGVAPHEREAQALARVAELLRRPFDLRRLPLLRVHAFRLADDHHLLAVVAHHVVLDAASVRLFVLELAAAYEAGPRGATAGLPPLPIQYADFAAWQRRAAGAGAFAPDLAFWQQRLAGLPEGLDLPIDHPRSQAGRRGAGRVERSLSPATGQALAELCRREGVTRYMVLLAAWGVLLSRLTHQDDICIGSPVSGRTRSEFEPLIGNFVNSVVMRLDTRGSQSFRALLAQTREVVAGAFSHQAAPLQQVLEVVRAAGEPHRKQLFQVLMNMVGPAGAQTGAALSGIRMEAVDGIDPPGSMVELALVVHDLPGRIAYHFDHDSGLFERASIERVADHFEVLIDALMARPDAPIRSLSMLCSAEQQWLLGNGRGRRQDVPALAVHELFAAQARRTPDAVAVYDRGTTLSYRQLDRRSNALALELRRRGLAPERFAFTLLEESLDVVVTWLAVLKAGGAFIPLDIGAPVHRNQQLLDAYPSCLLLGSPASRAGLRLDDARVLDVVGELREVESIEPAAVHPGHPIYAMFTSGSTGVPKGVVVTQWGIMNRLAWMEQHFEPGSAERALKTTRHTFDSSIWQIFWPLSNGGRTVIIDANMPDGVRANFELIRDQRVTAVDFVPSAFSAMREELDACAPAFDRLDALKLVIFGGEQVTRDGVDWFHQHCDAPVFNLYGPTEASIGCIHHRLERGFEGGIPIGRAIANTDILLLSPDLGLVPVGVSGEICLAGACLARGYLDQPAVTARSFIPSPFHEGERLYRTGDLGRWRPDGTLEFLGRIDHQVKIRGFRIELGEVETALLAHAAVGQAAVIAHEGDAGIKRLVAYVVPRAGAAVDTGELRGHVRALLPDYMQPAQIIALQALPMLPNGKLDRRSLPEPFEQAPADTDDEPRTEMERDVARVVCEVLGLRHVGLHDNYFDLGGDSIQSIRIVARARQIGVLVTAAQIFAEQSVERIAAVARRAGAEVALPSEPGGRVGLTPIQLRFLENADRPDSFCHTVVLQLRQPLLPQRVEQALQLLQAHHDALRLRFEHDEDGWTQAVAATAAPLDCEWHDLRGMADGEPRAGMRARIEALRSGLQITNGPLLRAALFDLGGQGQRLALVVHHLVVDAVSWGILLEDLQRVIREWPHAGQPPALPSKTASFLRWADRVQRHAADASLRAEAAWWTSRPWERAARLPQRPAAAGEPGDRVGLASRYLDPGATQALLSGAWAAHGLQLGELILACLAQAMAAQGGSAWQAISVEGHGRDDALGLDVSRTVGWFTTVHPVLLEVDAHADERRALAALREQLRSVPRRGFGFGVLKHVLRDAGIRQIVQPQVLFNFAGRLDTALDAQGLFGYAEENGGWEMGGGLRERHAIEVNASVRAGRLAVHWTWQPHQVADAVASGLADRMQAQLVRLAGAIVDAGVDGDDDFELLAVEQPGTAGV